MARLATGDTDDALDLVQDAMCDFARRYAARPEVEWNVLFYRVLQSRTTDWYRRSSVRNRFRAWLGRNDEDEGRCVLSYTTERAAPPPPWWSSIAITAFAANPPPFISNDSATTTSTR